MMRILFPAAVAALAACTSTGETIHESLPAAEGTAVPIGKAVEVGELTVEPLAVVEDSRCPENARCVWAGRLIVDTAISAEGWSERANLTLGETYETHGHSVALVSGLPEKKAAEDTPPATYRFAFEAR